MTPSFGWSAAMIPVAVILQLVSCPLCYLDPDPSWHQPPAPNVVHESHDVPVRRSAPCHCLCRPTFPHGNVDVSFPRPVRQRSHQLAVWSPLTSTRNLALVFWSPKFGSATIGTPAVSASKEEFQPQWVRKVATAGWASTLWWHHSTTNTCLATSSNPAGSPVSSSTDHGFDTHGKRFPLSFNPRANSATYKLKVLASQKCFDCLVSGYQFKHS